MATGVEPPEAEKVAGVRLEIPSGDDAAESPSRMPRRLRERLLECKTPSPTVEEIEAKLRDADLRRQQFYEKLSSKARPRPRSPSQSSSHDEDLSQRLEAKLQAAEQKRLSILAKAQMRLARLDELRQAAKTGVELRFEKEREELGTKVESRFQQAETNRMLILKAYKQRRATLKERISQSLLRRVTRESKYKERVRAAIYQKRAAAEKKRLGLLEAEKKRAHAKVSQARWVAKSVLHQREIERRRMKDQLDDRLQRAKRQRAEYLRQRGRGRSVRVNLNRLHKQADVLSRKIARCWKRFRKLRRTTLALARAYDALNINEQCAKTMPFEQLAVLIESAPTLQTVKALLDRLESRFKLSQSVGATPSPSSWDSIDHLLKKVASPNKRTPRNSNRSREPKRYGSNREAGKNTAKLSRYQVRVVLCAYMILCHPDAVFSCQGEHEVALANSAKNFVQELELLIKIILNGPIQSPDEEYDPSFPRRLTFRSQLAEFDRAWCTYLNSFVLWKAKDAESLEEDLVRAACQLELSMIQTCKMTPQGDSGALTHDMRAIRKQVTEDQKLLREKVRHLSGEAGIERMECALSDTRSKYFQAKESRSPLGSLITPFIPPGSPSSSAGPSSVAGSFKRSNAIDDSAIVAGSFKRSDAIDDSERPNRVIRSLFGKDASNLSHGSSTDPKSCLDDWMVFSGEKFVAENEFIVNEVVHDERPNRADSFKVTADDQSSIKVKIRETMEKAFWDGIIESLKQDKPSYDRVVELVKEVRDEICEMAPQSWEQEINEVLDLDILSQVLKSNELDMDYLRKILDFALITLQKLSAPAKDDEMKARHEELLKELVEICNDSNNSNYSHVIAMVRGLRFALEQIQALKEEISKARVRILEQFLKGPAGLEYLKTAFGKRYGSPSDAPTSMPLTVQWLSSIWDSKDLEWSEHTNSLSVLDDHRSSSPVLFPSTTLKTGGYLPANGSLVISPASTAINSSDNEETECKGENIDLLVRLGLLKLLVSSVTGLTHETLPETLKLNLTRLRGVQAQIQKIIVISTSVLICRQTLMSEQAVASPADMGTIVSKCINQLLDLLDRNEDAGIEEIVDTISQFPMDAPDSNKLQSRKEIMARMLAKSLQDGDVIFTRVSQAVYLAMRGVVLGGTGTRGKALAQNALRQMGAVALTQRVVEAAGVLVVASSVSVSVHGPWYTHIIGNM